MAVVVGPEQQPQLGTGAIEGIPRGLAQRQLAPEPILVRFVADRQPLGRYLVERAPLRGRRSSLRTPSTRNDVGIELRRLASGRSDLAAFFLEDLLVPKDPAGKT
jgi:hypothetical protein